MRRTAYLGLAALVLAGAGTALSAAMDETWTAQEVEMIGSLSLAALGPVPDDPSNAVADDPRAVELGKAIFTDPRFSADGTVSCASCHQADRQFQDGLPLGKGVGQTGRRTMPIAGMAYSPFLFWDGRKDSLWSQALGPMESPVEHGGDRTQYARLVATAYRKPYEDLFGPIPDLDHLPDHAGPVANPTAAANWQAMSEQDRRAVSQVFAGIGKVIAAYERTIGPPTTRFDSFAQALREGGAQGGLEPDELAGLRIFLGKGECVNCHNGPLFSDLHFHNTGVNAVGGAPVDAGRQAGAVSVRDDPFNCLGDFSDAGPKDCAELRFMASGGKDEIGAFKTPSLRGALSRSPYMHAGQIATISDVLRHYSQAPKAEIGQSELRRKDFSDAEIRQLTAFLATLEPVADAGGQAAP